MDTLLKQQVQRMERKAQFKDGEGDASWQNGKLSEGAGLGERRAPW